LRATPACRRTAARQTPLAAWSSCVRGWPTKHCREGHGRWTQHCGHKRQL
jgi:hypothetical protein